MSTVYIQGMKASLAIVLGVVVLGGIVFGLSKYGSSSESCPLKNPANETNEPTTNTSRKPVLVELFTSEGCSSCPPADRELTFLQERQPVTGAEVVALSFHVDYWDRLGWKDAFSSAEYSERQNDYTNAKNLDSNYTPQMVVDGDEQFVGSDGQKANLAIGRASNSAKGSVEISLADKTLEFKLTDLPAHKGSKVYVAIAEDGLETKVGAGENGGRTLAHTSVVRKLISAGNVAAGKSEFAGKVELATETAWKTENLKYVVFVQEDTDRKVIAVSQARATLH